MVSRTSLPDVARPASLSCSAAGPGLFGRSSSKAFGIKRPFLFIVVFVLVPLGGPADTKAQDFSRNSVYIEGAVSGHVYSVNYERRLSAHLGARTGVMIRTRGKHRGEATTIPVMIQLLDGFHRLGKHRFELGSGPLLGVVRRRLEDGTVSREIRGGFIIAVGYRYQPLEDGVLFRLGLTLFNSGGSLGQARHLGIGYTF